MGAEVTIPERISSAIILASAVSTAAAPKAHLFFPYLEYRAVSVMCGELGIEEGETIFKGGQGTAGGCVLSSHIYNSGCYKRRHS